MTRPRVVVLDYGSGNLRSAARALARVGGDVEVSADPDVALRAAGLVVPGVGAFAACMAGLAPHAAAVCDRVARARPVLGICVGMQILFATGDEHGVSTRGLAAFDGDVTRLAAAVLPHMGWNNVAPPPGSVLFRGVADERFYFLHSYAARSAPGLVTHAEHGERFVAAVEDGALAATQFHPEKSGAAGLALLDNWLGTLG